jgi:hypothetical protein
MGVIIHAVLFPALLAASHTTSVYLLFKLFGGTWATGALIIAYMAVVIPFYIQYYKKSVEFLAQRFHKRNYILTCIIALVLSIASFLFLWHKGY